MKCEYMRDKYMRGGGVISEGGYGCVFYPN